MAPSRPTRAPRPVAPGRRQRQPECADRPPGARAEEHRARHPRVQAVVKLDHSDVDAARQLARLVAKGDDKSTEAAFGASGVDPSKPVADHRRPARMKAEGHDRRRCGCSGARWRREPQDRAAAHTDLGEALLAGGDRAGAKTPDPRGAGDCPVLRARAGSAAEAAASEVGAGRLPFGARAGVQSACNPGCAPSAGRDYPTCSRSYITLASAHGGHRAQEGGLMSLTLPPRPSLDHLKKQAKDRLQRAAGHGPGHAARGRAARAGTRLRLSQLAETEGARRGLERGRGAGRCARRSHAARLEAARPRHRAAANRRTSSLA